MCYQNLLLTIYGDITSSFKTLTVKCNPQKKKKKLTERGQGKGYKTFSKQPGFSLTTGGNIVNKFRVCGTELTFRYVVARVKLTSD